MFHSVGQQCRVQVTNVRWSIHIEDWCRDDWCSVLVLVLIIIVIRDILCTGAVTCLLLEDGWEMCHLATCAKIGETEEHDLSVLVLSLFD